MLTVAAKASAVQVIYSPLLLALLRVNAVIDLRQLCQERHNFVDVIISTSTAVCHLASPSTAHYFLLTFRRKMYCFVQTMEKLQLSGKLMFDIRFSTAVRAKVYN